LVNTKETIEEIKKQNLSSQANLLSLILVLMDFYKGNPGLHEKLYNFYLNHKKEVEKEYDGKKTEQKKNEKESEKWVQLDKLKKVPDYWRRRFNKSKTETNALYWVLSSLYMTANYCPPRRNIFASVKYHQTNPKNEPSGNYFVRSPKAKFVFQDYKTANKHGKVVINIPKNSRMLKAIDAYRTFNNSNYLLQYKTKKPFTTDQMTKTLYTVFQSAGKNISSSMLRKIYISEKFECDTKLEEREKLATKMGHSVGTQMKYYEKK